MFVNIGHVVAAQSVAQSMTSNKKASTISDGKSKGAGAGLGGKAGAGQPAVSSGEGASQVSLAYILCDRHSMFGSSVTHSQTMDFTTS